MIETATAACSVALIEDGAVIAAAHEHVSRGHAERLLPMIAELPGGGRADAILVDCGPGSFTGIRVGVAAARALALGWGVPVHGYSSLALIAAGYFAAVESGPVTVAIPGGHGEVFAQDHDAGPVRATGVLVSASPETIICRDIVIGAAAPELVARKGAGIAIDRHPDARDGVSLTADLASLPPTPIYGRGADAKPMA